MSSLRSEDELGRKWDRFGANCLVKIGAGLAVGTVFSVILLRRRIWPVYVGIGTGLGFALNDLQHDLRSKN